jgi:soluble lytic murein transglycosylase-like protein
METRQILLSAAGIVLIAAAFSPAKTKVIVSQTVSDAITNTDWIKALKTRGAAYIPYFKAAESKYGIPAGLLARMAYQESRFRQDIITGAVKSGADARGIMQIIPRWHPGVNPLNPPEAIDYAGKFVSDLYRKYKRWDYAVMAYNWGAGNMDKWIKGQRTLPVETKNYGLIVADIRGGNVYV